MSPKRSVAWKSFERVIASLFGSFRTPLSGVNSRHGGGDVIVPDGFSMLIECKTRVGSQHWTLFDEAQRDAKKNNVDPLHTLLFFKQKAKHGFICTMDGEMFERIWQIEEVRELFK